MVERRNAKKWKKPNWKLRFEDEAEQMRTGKKSSTSDLTEELDWPSVLLEAVDQIVGKSNCWGLQRKKRELGRTSFGLWKSVFLKGKFVSAYN